MFQFTLGAVLAALATPAAAASFRLQIDPGQGPMLEGRAGLHALDIFTPETHVRIIAPGNRIDRRGTVRVLVKNLGKPSYEFGPDEVSVELADGTPLPEIPVEKFDRAEEMVGVEVGRAQAIRWAIDGSLESVDAQGLFRLEDPVPGAALFDSLSEVLRPYPVGPKEAWGGYLVFDVPKDLRRRRTDLPVNIVVKTGNETHRIKATLNRL